MFVLGISGGPSAINEFDSPDLVRAGTCLAGHDSAAVLLRDGVVVAAVEQERLDRIKHSNKIATAAIRAVLREAGIRFSDLDHVAYYLKEDFLDAYTRQRHMNGNASDLLPAREQFQRWFAREFGAAPARDRLHFVPHHLTHAASAFYPSGFDRSLVVTLDGSGEYDSGSVYRGVGRELHPIHSFDLGMSLGELYYQGTAFLGYRMFDEYKVMGLAPYGDPSRFRANFRELYALKPGGLWSIDFGRIFAFYELLAPRFPGEPVTQEQQDFAAGLQEMLEGIVLHALEHWRASTGEQNLCLAGGVAHNCSMNGRVLRSGLFERVFVQPASHDAGGALGAALHVHMKAASDAKCEAVRHVYWGPAREDGQDEAELQRWRSVLDFERVENIPRRVAELIAEGAVIGWMQGRSEFGPRALGNRSILADPRPASNKDRINEMIKKREAFRPFAPAVLEESVAEYFEVDPTQNFPFMVFVVRVQEQQRKLLGAVTHVDGTARVQTVSKRTNPLFWSLIDEFRKLTACPILLNTSFNNNAEPIVETARDAIVCFLTTGLDYLVLGEYLVKRRPAPSDVYLDFCIDVPAYVRVLCARATGDGGDRVTEHYLSHTGRPSLKVPISEAVYEILSRADGRESLAELCSSSTLPKPSAVLPDLRKLWAQRLVRLSPNAATPPR